MSITNQILVLVFVFFFIGGVITSIGMTMASISSSENNSEGLSLLIIWTIFSYAITGVFGFFVYYYSKKTIKPFSEKP